MGVVSRAPQPQPLPTLEDLPTAELVRQALQETKELARLEIKLAREELREDLLQLKRAAILIGIAAVLGIVAIALLDVAVVIALGGTVGSALLITGIVVAEVAILGYIGYRQLPKTPLQHTRARLSADLHTIEEHLK
jgi:uncharacterized membrane protein YqjE